ncbi:MAG: UDP-N-acetylmuramoyl-tripeptide--D-alanyl-D-alanine ligase [Anaerolineales bacterium]|nr:UDP-N-acetylmuramoyl-tripeptide--D-alanyl-D-alanine ligase [Anaerolineales bacterium]
MLTMADVVEALTGIRPEEAVWHDAVITEGAIDSRQAIPGSLFIAVRGERVDGHIYVEHAFSRGASCALIQEDLTARVPVLDLRAGWDAQAAAHFSAETEGAFCLWVNNTVEALQQIARFRRARMDLEVIGITGSVGKSTTKELVAEVLGQRYRTLKNKGNLNNEIGLPLTLLSLSPGHQRAVLEMGFYVPGEIAFLCEIARPRIGLLTNIGTVHAERAGSQEMIARGKAELVQSLPKDGWAILNYDDPWVRGMAEQTQARVFFYGMDSAADLWADEVEGRGLEGIQFRLHYQGDVIHLRVPLIGRHSVHTALRAAAVGLVDGLTWQEIVAGLRFATTQLRLIAVRSTNGALLLDDTYNASPESMLAALNLLDELEGRKVAVLGDMLELGQYEWRGHEMVGIRVAEVAQELVTIGERGRMIAAAACRAGFPSQAIHECESVEQVIELLKESLRPEDVVLVKGSHGMRMDRIVAALEYQQ